MMCDFNADTLRCRRCGYLAKRLPTYRVCRTIPEMAVKIATEQTTRRIAVPPLPLGTAVSRGLAAFGVTPQRIKKAIGRDCGCDKRKAILDAAGAAISSIVERGANAMLNAVLPSPVGPDDFAAVANSLQASPLTNQGLKDGPPPEDRRKHENHH
jgi:hypothetical protein